MPIEKLKELLYNETVPQDETARAVNSFDHFEIARLLFQLPLENKVLLFQLLDSNQKRQELLYETDHDSRIELIGSLDRKLVAKLLDEMPEDDAADILKELSPEIQEELLANMGPKDAGIIKNLIRFDEETAGGLMTPHFNRVSPYYTAADILMKIKREPNSDSPYFYVVDGGDELLGFFQMRDLLNVPPTAKAEKIMRKDVPKVLLEDPCEKVAELMDYEHLSAIPVVDDKNVIQGIITFDDVLRAMQDIASEDIFTMVGTAKADPFAKRATGKIFTRFPWLLTTFVGGIANALILHHFELSLREFGTILFFIPFVMGLAGNVGIQGATVIVRGLATGDIKSDNIRTVVTSEFIVGTAMGLIFGMLCGLLVAVLSGPLLHSTPKLGVTVGAGISLAILFTSFIGVMAPIFFRRIGIDPAISAGPVVTVLDDVMSLTIYMTTATLLFTVI
ncbi:MAG: magnesium transporter [Nitrospinae bacterium]|nr:magnesium transporter [Nitrospinota bacterium]